MATLSQAGGGALSSSPLTSPPFSFGANPFDVQSASQSILQDVRILGTHTGSDGGFTNSQVTLQPGDQVPIQAMGGTVEI